MVTITSSSRSGRCAVDGVRKIKIEQDKMVQEMEMVQDKIAQEMEMVQEMAQDKMVQEDAKDTDRAQGMGAAQEIDIELAAISDEFENTPAQEIVEWAVEQYGRALALACSFQDCVIIDLANRVDSDMEVIFLDTGYHFPETIAYVEQVNARYGLNLTITVPGDDAADWPCGSARCCEFRKVGPLQRTLEGKTAWMTALKRCDSPTRSSIPIVSWDSPRGMVKVNPLATWSDQDIDSYIDSYRLPVHPLMERGYLSIGCAPTTRPIQSGEHPRAGRWAGTGKTECGLHT